jgi:hypothetical protein
MSMVKARRAALRVTFILALFCASACSTSETTEGMNMPTTTSSAAQPNDGNNASISGTIVRFSRMDTSVDVTITNDNQATRAFLAQLPMTIELSDLNRKEKIGYLPQKLDVGDTPGSDPEDGDLIYFVPWGNIGFYYDASGIEYSDSTINLGRYQASASQLAALEGGPVSVFRA